MTDEEILGSHQAPLDADNVPDVNQSHYCYSCEEPMKGLYCIACGQKNDNYRRSIFSLIWETVASVTALEGRMWRTAVTLIAKPGKVAREFADGARTKWSSPVRAYLAMSLLLFGYLSIFNVNIMSLDVNLVPERCATGTIADLPADQLRLSVKPKFFEPSSVYNARLASRDTATIEKRIIEQGLNFKFDIGESDEACDATAQSEQAQSTPESETDTRTVLQQIKDDVDAAMSSEDVQSALEDAKTKKAVENDGNDTSTPQRLNDNTIVLNGKTVKPETIAQMGLVFMRDPARLNRSFAGYIPRLMFFMMPLTMLIGWMFIRGRGNALLYDHLVHASYVHAVTYFLIFTALLLSRVMPGGFLVKALSLILMIYLPLSAKKMFARGWIKTIWTAYGVGFIYLIILIMGLSILMATQLQNVLVEIESLSTALPTTDP